MIRLPALRLTLLAPLALMASACGLKPLYGGGAGGAVAGTLSHVEVAPIEGKAGWLMSNALRERRTLRARYQLVDLNDGSVLLDATAGSDAGIDVVQSEYATIAAENTALERLSGIVADQIVSRLAVYANRRPAGQ